MANPEVLHASGQMREHDEASPNLPGVSAVISRPRAVTVRFLNAEGEIEDRDFVELWATSVQHQIDHLAGKMYFDHLSPLKRKMLIAKAEKLRARMMKIVFMGTPEFSVPVLEALAAAHEVVCVYCQPPRPAGRGKADRPQPGAGARPRRWACRCGTRFRCAAPRRRRSLPRWAPMWRWWWPMG